MWLPWRYGLVLSVFFAVVALAAGRRQSRSRNADLVAAVGWEAARVAVLYSLWQLAGRISLLQIDEAIRRGEWLYELERGMGLLDEKWLQDQLIGNDIIIQASNLYYAGAHVPAMGVFLVAMFLARRDDYPRWRNALVVVTGMCLAVQLVPLAPPRLVESLAIVDTPALHGQSVYTALGYEVAGELQAMPSVHVAWAAIIALGAHLVSDGWVRHLGWGHFVLTNFVVVVTGNHYWLDGFVAIAFLLGVVGVQRLVDSRRQVEDPAGVERQTSTI